MKSIQKLYQIALITCLGVGGAQAATQYQLTYLGANLIARGINDMGVVVGDAVVSHGSGNPVTYSAFYYDGTVHANVLGSGASTSSAYGVNENGTIVGTYTTSSGVSHAFSYDGSLHDLGTLGGTSSVAYGINNLGQIVGAANNSSGNQHAFLYDGTMHDLGTLGGTQSVARAINDAGVIAGNANTNPTRSYLSHAFLYDGTMHDLGTLGGSSSSATAINSAGVVAGGSSTSDENDGVAAFLYNGSLQGFAYDWGTAHGINSSNVVVGIHGDAGIDRQSAFVYDGTFADLNTLIVGGVSGFRLYDATGINSAGQIIANGTNGAYLLTPVPLPAAAWLFASSLGFFGLKMRSRAK